MVARVKDAVRPGKPMDYEQERYHADGGGGGGVWAEVGGGVYPQSPPYWGQTGGMQQSAGGYASPTDKVYGQHQQTGAGGYGQDHDQRRARGLHDPWADADSAAAASSLGGYTHQQNEGGVAPAVPHSDQEQQQQQRQQNGSDKPVPWTFDGGARSPEFAGQHGESGDGGELGGDGWQPSLPPESSYGADASGSSGVGGVYVDSSSQEIGMESKIAGGGAPVVWEGPQGARGDSSPVNLLPTHRVNEDRQVAPGQTMGYGEQQQPVVGQGWAAARIKPVHAAPLPQHEQHRHHHAQQQMVDRMHKSTSVGGRPAASPPLPHSGASMASSLSNGPTAAGDEDGVLTAVRPVATAAAEATGGATERAMPSTNAKTEVRAEQNALSGGEEAVHTSAADQHNIAHAAVVGKSSDPMPSSADHGLEKLDWGEGAEEDDEGVVLDGSFVSGGVFSHGEQEEREEEALIRELERMDAIGGGEALDAAPAPAKSAELQAEVENSDEAVEHTLDVLFDSIRGEDDNGNSIDVDIDPVSDDICGDEAFAATEPSAPADGSLPAASKVHAVGEAAGAVGSSEFQDQLEDCAAGEADTTANADDQQQSRWQETGNDFPARPSAGSASSKREYDEAKYVDGAAVAWSTDVEGEGEEQAGQPALYYGEQNAAAASTPSINSEADIAYDAAEGGSLWGKSERWASLPNHASVVYDLGENQAEEEGDKEEELGYDDDEVDIVVPLDPIELPPSAASDEIWNDQHLQEQLDAYWEQSRRAGGGGGNVGGESAGGASAGRRQQRQQQLSMFPGDLQAIYGPGDWVGRRAGPEDWLGRGALQDGTEMMVPQQKLPGVIVDGIPRSGNNWVSPNLFHGNQAPINIYGNVHVHLPGKQGGDEQSPSGSQELRARERYYSQGETSWSGSERGSQ